LGHGEAGDGAAAVSEVEEALAKHVLAHALNDEPLGLGCAGRGAAVWSAKAFQSASGSVRERLGAQRAVQSGEFGDPQRS
jgi:hypothetical protein